MAYSGVNEDGRDATQGAKLGAAGAPPVDRPLSLSCSPHSGIPNGEKGGLFCPAMGRKKIQEQILFQREILAFWVESDEIDPKHF